MCAAEAIVRSYRSHLHLDRVAKVYTKVAGVNGAISRKRDLILRRWCCYDNFPNQPASSVFTDRRMPQGRFRPPEADLRDYWGNERAGSTDQKERCSGRSRPGPHVRLSGRRARPRTPGSDHVRRPGRSRTYHIADTLPADSAEHRAPRRARTKCLRLASQQTAPKLY